MTVGAYSRDFRERALRMLAEVRPDHASDHAACKYVAGKIGMTPETLRVWRRRADGDAGGVSGEAQAEIKRLKKQVSSARFLCPLRAIVFARCAPMKLPVLG